MIYGQLDRGIRQMRLLHQSVEEGEKLHFHVGFHLEKLQISP